MGFYPLAAQNRAQSVMKAGEKAVVRRQGQLSTAEAKMLDGDRKNADGDVAGAYEAYLGAFEAVPQFSAAAEFHRASFGKYQTSARAYAKQLASEGRRVQAVGVVERVYETARVGNVTNLLDQKTKFLLEDLKDGETYEPAVTPEHIKRVALVKEHLNMARAQVRVGQYDEANETLFKAINLDPTNQAARRALENVEELRAAYYKTAQDQTRATMLEEVNKQWALPVPRYGLEFKGTKTVATVTDRDSVQAKLNSIILPSVEFEDTPLPDVINFLVNRSRQLDDISPPDEKGVNIVLSNNVNAAETNTITLKLREVPLGEVLRYVTQMARMKYRVDRFAVTVVPLTAAIDDDLITKRYPVPPNFISAGAIGGGAGGGDPFADDPFAEGGGGGGGALKARLTAQEFLIQNGIKFPEGAVARFIKSTSTLLVSNTQDQLELIEAMIDGAFGSVTKMLYFEVKVLDISENDLEEIGFDWLLGQFNVPGSERVFGGGGTQGYTGAALNPDDFPFVAPGSGPLGDFPLTGGNRNESLPINSIDGRIANDSGLAVSNRKSAGVFSIGGVFTDPQFQMVAHLLSQKAGRDKMSNIGVVSRAGQIATVKAIREFTYPSEFDAPEVPDTVGGGGGGNNFNNNNQNNNTSNFAPVTPAHPAAFDMRELGSTMEIEGTIDPVDNTIQVTLNPAITEFDGFINYGSPIVQLNPDGSEALRTENGIRMPIFRTTRNTTSINVYDGATISIGGLHEARKQMKHDEIPILGEIPGIGNLFQSHTEVLQNRAIIFFVTVRIVDPAGNVVRDQTSTPR